MVTMPPIHYSQFEGAYITYLLVKTILIVDLVLDCMFITFTTVNP